MDFSSITRPVSSITMARRTSRRSLLIRTYARGIRSYAPPRPRLDPRTGSWLALRCEFSSIIQHFSSIKQAISSITQTFFSHKSDVFINKTDIPIHKTDVLIHKTDMEACTNFLKFWDFPKFGNQIPVFGIWIPKLGFGDQSRFFNLRGRSRITIHAVRSCVVWPWNTCVLQLSQNLGIPKISESKFSISKISELNLGFPKFSDSYKVMISHSKR